MKSRVSNEEFLDAVDSLSEIYQYDVTEKDKKSGATHNMDTEDPTELYKFHTVEIDTILNYLKENKDDPNFAELLNQTGQSGSTALTAAVKHGFYNIAEAICNLAREMKISGVVVNKPDVGGYTPLEYCIKNTTSYKERMLGILVTAHEIDLNTVNANHKTPLFYAVATNNSAAVLKLILFGAKLIPDPTIITFEALLTAYYKFLTEHLEFSDNVNSSKEIVEQLMAQSKKEGLTLPEEKTKTYTDSETKQAEDALLELGILPETFETTFPPNLDLNNKSLEIQCSHISMIREYIRANKQSQKLYERAGEHLTLYELLTKINYNLAKLALVVKNHPAYNNKELTNEEIYSQKIYFQRLNQLSDFIGKEIKYLSVYKFICSWEKGEMPEIITSAISFFARKNPKPDIFRQATVAISEEVQPPLNRETTANYANDVFEDDEKSLVINLNIDEPSMTKSFSVRPPQHNRHGSLADESSMTKSFSVKPRYGSEAEGDEPSITKSLSVRYEEEPHHSRRGSEESVADLLERLAQQRKNSLSFLETPSKNSPEKSKISRSAKTSPYKSKNRKGSISDVSILRRSSHSSDDKNRNSSPSKKDNLKIPKPKNKNKGRAT